MLRLFFDLNTTMEIVLNSKNPELATLNPGPICNLACATCNEHASTKWQGIVKRYPDRSFTGLENLDFSGIKHIVVGGGEPILHKNLLPVMQSLTSSGIGVTFHLNGSIKPADKWIETFNMFNPEKLMLMFSIDAVGVQFEYLRWPAKWTETVDNIYYTAENTHAPQSINQTISFLTKDTFHDVGNWANDQSIVFDSVNVQYATEYMDLSKFDQVDAIRNTNWRIAFPEIAQQYPIGTY